MNIEQAKALAGLYKGLREMYLLGLSQCEKCSDEILCDMCEMLKSSVEHVDALERALEYVGDNESDVIHNVEVATYHLERIQRKFIGEYSSDMYNKLPKLGE